MSTLINPAPASLDTVPWARGLPLLGSVVPMFLDPVGFLLAEHRRLGPIFRLRALHHRFTVLAGPEANALLSRTADRFLAAAPSWGAFSREFDATHVLPGVDGALHYKLRRVQQQAYSRSTIATRLPEAAKIARDVLATQRPGPVKLVPLCRRIVTEQLGALILGRGPGEYLDDIALVVRFALNARFTQQWPVQILGLPRYQRARKRFLEFGRAILDDHDASGGPGPALLNDLRAAVAADPGFISDADRVMVALGPFIAGLDTVANTVAFMIAALLRLPDAYARVEADAHALLADGAPTVQRLVAARALQGALQETLRLYPVAPLIYRHIAQPLEFGGYVLPKGERVLFGTTLFHRMAEHFPEPDRFDIDRPHHDIARKATPLAAYGLGPHTCAGSGFAEVQMLLVAATLLHHASFARTPDAPAPRVTRDPAPTLGQRFTIELLTLRT